MFLWFPLNPNTCVECSLTYLELERKLPVIWPTPKTCCCYLIRLQERQRESNLRMHWGPRPGQIQFIFKKEWSPVRTISELIPHPSERWMRKRGSNFDGHWSMLEWGGAPPSRKTWHLEIPFWRSFSSSILVKAWWIAFGRTLVPSIEAVFQANCMQIVSQLRIVHSQSSPSPWRVQFHPCWKKLSNSFN